MMNLFKNTKEKVKTVLEKPKSVQETIEEIHESFYTEVDKLLEEAKISKSTETDKQDLIDKCKRLKKLGFTNTKEVIQAQIEIDRLSNVQRQNRENKELVEAINYFSFKYPNYKFITEDSVKKICEKYGLIYGTVDRYKGTVPDKNLQHIEDFQIEEDDMVYQEVYHSQFGSRIRGYFDKRKYDINIKREMEINDNTRLLRGLGGEYCVFEKCPLEIAAPPSDFDTSGMQVKDFKLQEIPDPVVLQPVLYKNNKYYLIVTAWGLEASDELVVNEKMN